MKRFIDFIAYPFSAMRWAVCAWWSIVRGNLGWSAIAAIAVFVIGLTLHQQIINRWPDLEQFIGKPADEVMSYLIYGVLSVGIFSIAILFGLIVASPSQMWHEQKQQIASLLPPPLHITFQGGVAAITSSDIQLNGKQLTNRSTDPIDVRFLMSIEFNKTDGTKGRTAVQGVWLGHGASNQCEFNIAVPAKSAVVGDLTFPFPSAENMGVSQWNVKFNDCVLEIRDAISGASVGCKPDHGFPNGAIDLPLPPLATSKQ